MRCITRAANLNYFRLTTKYFAVQTSLKINNSIKYSYDK